MEKEKVSYKDFHFKYAPQIKRIWNHEKEIGIGFSQLAQAPFEISDLTHIFIREDGWAIVCTDEGVETCHKLWEGSWREIITKAW